MALPVSSLTGPGIPSPASQSAEEPVAPSDVPMDVDQGGNKDVPQTSELKTLPTRFYIYNKEARNPPISQDCSLTWGNYDSYKPEDFQKDNQLTPFNPILEGPVAPGTKVIDTAPQDAQRKWVTVIDNTQRVNTFFRDKGHSEANCPTSRANKSATEDSS